MWVDEENEWNHVCMPAVQHVIYVIVSYFWLRDLRGRNGKCKHKLEDRNHKSDVGLCQPCCSNVVW